MREAPPRTVSPPVVLEADERNLIGADAADLAAPHFAALGPGNSGRVDVATRHAALAPVEREVFTVALFTI